MADMSGNAFLEALRELRSGESLADLHEALRSLVGHVRSVGKSGTLTLTLSVSLAKGSTHTLVIADELKLKEPKPDREVTFMYADDDNRLSRRDPRQPKLPAMDVSEVRRFNRPHAVNETVNPRTGEISE